MPARRETVPTSRPLDVSDEDWCEAVRREGEIRRLVAAGANSGATINAAADALGLSSAQVYRLMDRFRRAPITASLVTTKPGTKKGARLLPGPVERQIDDAIERIFKSRERPSMAKLRRDIWTDCCAAGLQPPSRKAIQVRVSARPLRELARARDGAKMARQRFEPVQPGLRPRSPLALDVAKTGEVHLRRE